MARERSIVVRLKAEISDFSRQMGSASRTLTAFEREQQKMGGAATTTMGRLVQNAKINRQEWETVGRTLATTGAAMLAIGGAALKVGIDYNSLRQSATQSLTAVTGSTEEAAAQMRRLDEFGQNSWLMRDTLVRAQQQMTGFGIETEKVIPYMDGLAEAVAAAGGSNQDFEELALVMGKVQSQGKLTARELEQFGVRGIDAAQMIANAMGTTADDIRSQITAGTLDAETALDALAEGMQTTFAGSSDLVRDSFSGAVDNAKAAFRDLMAELATPLVDPEGGGFLVDATNKLADFLNLLREAPQPVKIAVGAMGGVAGAGALIGGSFLLLFPRIIDVIQGMEKLAVTSPKAARALGALGRSSGPIALAITTATALFSVLNKLGEVKLPEWDVAHFEGALIDIAGGTESASASLDEFFEVSKNVALVPWDSTVRGLGGFGEALDRVANKDLQDKLQGFFSFVPSITDADFQHAVDGLNSLDEALANMVSSGNAEEAEAAWLQMREEANDLGITTDQLIELFPQYEAALKSAENQTRLNEGETEDYGDALAEVNELIGTQADRLSDLTSALQTNAQGVLDSRAAERKWLDALDDTREAIKENGATLDISTEKGRANEEQLDRLIDTGWERIESLRQTTASEKELQDAMEEVRAEVIQAAEDMGMSGREAEKFADKLGLIPKDVHIDIEARTDRAERNIQGLMSKWNNKTLTFYARMVNQNVGPPKGHPAGSQADGSVRVRSFASGGFSSLPKHAVIQRATPGLIQWAEPETQGEAFIPLAPAKRARSLAIWEETGRRLGALESRAFANGGFNVPSPVSSSAVSVAVSALSDSDVARIASAVREGSLQGSAAGVSAGFSSGSSDVARSARMGG